MHELKKSVKLLTSKFVGTGPSSNKKKLPGRGLTKVEKYWAIPLEVKALCSFDMQGHSPE